VFAVGGTEVGEIETGGAVVGLGAGIEAGTADPKALGIGGTGGAPGVLTAGGDSGVCGTTFGTGAGTVGITGGGVTGLVDVALSFVIYILLV
jgi:hypothetical protein